MQDQVVADFISSAAQIIGVVQAYPEIAAALAARGYDAAELANGRRLQAAAQASFDARQKALGHLTDAKQARDAAWTSAWDEYMDFRSSARVGFADRATRDALGVSGNCPRDIQKFVTQATGSYRLAQAAPYLDYFAKCSFTAARLAAAEAALAELLVRDSAFKAADGEATTETGDRDEAVARLRAWMKGLRTHARLALKDAPEQLARLGW